MAANQKIAAGFFDSGAGGLSVLYEFLKDCDFEHAIYFGDNKNAPYGSKSRRELIALAVSGTERLLSAGANIVVMACGTLSTNALQETRRLFPDTPVFGVFPPLERALVSGKRTVAFATPKTAKSLVKSVPFADVIPLEGLAKEIEDNLFSLEKIDLSAHVKGADKNAEKVVLGCTHYALMSDRFAQLFPRAEILFGGTDTLRTAKAFLQGADKGVYNGFRRANGSCGGGSDVFLQNSDHFGGKNYGVLTTSDTKNTNLSFKLEKMAKTGRFLGKTVDFVGQDAGKNFQAFTNICSFLTKSTK